MGPGRAAAWTALGAALGPERGRPAAARGWRYLCLCRQPSVSRVWGSLRALHRSSSISLWEQVLPEKILRGAVVNVSSSWQRKSPGSGLYSNLEQYDLPYPEAIFELDYFFHNPKPFFALAKELYPGNYRPNLAHYFLRLLHDKGLLLRLYTQNIDGLERDSLPGCSGGIAGSTHPDQIALGPAPHHSTPPAAGIPATKLVEAHGTFASATCTVCQQSFPGEEFQVDVMADRVPCCPICTGIIKPDIVFFGEQLPQRFFLHMADFPMADLLIIIGTSLEVEPFASLCQASRRSVPRVLINRELVGPFAWQPRDNDVAQLGDIISGVETLVKALGWTKEIEDLIQRETDKDAL
uniref:Sirtuin 3 n=1 Tax=Vombatus ursinus TaxID=29139 RepID=A0A4X2K7E3_VOMUR